MKRILRFLIRLYPAWWRRRYGKELEALLEDAGSSWRDVWDLLRTAMEMQMKAWSFGRIVTVCGIAGVLLAGTIAFSMPYRYESTAILKIPAGPQATVVVNEAAILALNRSSLTTVIKDRNLYVSELRTMKVEDVLERMRRSIEVRPAGAGLVAIRYVAKDPSTAQQVTQTLAGRFTGFQVLDPPSTPRRVTERKRYGLAGLGLPAGMLFGAVLALILRRRTSAAS